MFELYFGAFDLVLYALAFIAAVMIFGGICDVLESESLVRQPASTRPGPSYIACKPLFQPIATLSIKSPPVQEPSAEIPSSLMNTQRKPILRISEVRLYKLHQQSVVQLSALPFSIPDTIKRYMLRGEPVVLLEALQAIATVIA
ncbi:MAG: hypothetical protein AAFU53_01150 [Cyanobacteria bacterium J06632_3]